MGPQRVPRKIRKSIRNHKNSNWMTRKRDQTSRQSQPRNRPAYRNAAIAANESAVYKQDACRNWEPGPRTFAEGHALVLHFQTSRPSDEPTMGVCSRPSCLGPRNVLFRANRDADAGSSLEEADYRPRAVSRQERVLHPTTLGCTFPRCLRNSR